MGLKVIDLYCGAGGFSEGFRQMGFDVVAGFDNWDEARITYSKNQPGSWVPEKYSNIPRFRGDIVRLIRERIGEIDVVIGGPPCVEYSSSKNGGNGNVKSGLRQVRAFFEIVEDLEPEYWIMENVPRIETFMEEAIGKGYLSPPARRKKWVFDSQYHGVPQARRRLFTGDFPGEVVSGWEEQRKRTGSIVPMKAVVEGYPSCYGLPSHRKTADPLYNRLIREQTEITDHFGYGRSLELSSLERQMNVDLKQHHRQYGRMDFPEDLDFPSRTIMATQFAVSRESLIVNGRQKGKFRRLTPRECASLQGYPMVYPFWGESVGAKYRLIGNSVPVGLARDLAKSILLDKNLSVPKFPLLLQKDSEIPPITPIPPKKLHILHERFQWHPFRSMVKGCRVDLDNTQKYAQKPSDFPVVDGLKHTCRWDAVLHAGIGRPRWRFEQVEQEMIFQALREVGLEPKRQRKLLKGVKSLHGAIPDASTLVWAHQHPSRGNWRYSTNWVWRPRYLLDIVDRLRQRTVGDLRSVVDCRDQISICPEKGLPSDVIVAAFILYWMCREINCCTSWMLANKSRRDQSPTSCEEFRRDACFGVLSKDFPTSLA